MKSIVVIGSGIIGLSCAYYLLQEGHEVTVVEASEEPIDNCSMGNSGLIVPSHFVPLASPGMLGYGMKQMMDDSSPFGVANPYDLGFIKWAKLFANSCRASRAAEAAPLLRDIHRKSKSLYLELSQGLNQSFLVHQNGLAMICRSQDQWQEEIHFGRQANSIGIGAEVVSQSELQKLLPGVSQEAIGGVFFPEDASVDPGQVNLALRDYCKDKAQFIDKFSVEKFESNSRRIVSASDGNKRIFGDSFVVCTGSNLQSTCRLLDSHLPIQAGKGYSVTVPSSGLQLNCNCIDGSARLAITPLDGKVRFGGTLEIGAWLDTINEAKLERMRRSIQSLFPSIEIEVLERAGVWSGLRPLSPDGLPYIGMLKKWDNVAVAGGHAMMGMSLGPITGKLISEAVSGLKPSLNTTLLDPNRYD